MILVLTVKLLLVFLLSSQALAQELNSTLHSNVYGAPVAYTDEMVVFTCVVRGSNSMAWTSEEYIGTGGQRMELSTAESVGTRYSAVGNIQTVAELISATIDEIIVTQLRIRITSTFSIASVQCLNINASTMNCITFLLADSTSIKCDRQSACPGENVTCTCATGNSNTLAWMSNGSTLTFASNDSLLIRRDVNESSTSAVLTESSNRNGVRVIMSNLTFIASTKNILMCKNIDRLISKPFIVPVPETCPDPSNQVTTPARNDDASTKGIQVGLIAAAIVFAVIALVAVLTVVIVAPVGGYCYNKHTKQIKKLKEDKRKLKKELKSKTEKADELATANEGLNKKLTAANVEKKDLQCKYEKEISDLKAKLERAEAGTTS